MGQLLYSGQRAPRFVLGVPNVTDHLSRVSVPTAYYQMWHYTWGDSDIISSCHYLCQLFSRGGQALRNVCYCDITFLARQW